ncbi:MAG TPA: hypothetical protein VIG76_08460 [Amnibacterium sp.]|jgi:hypothetical protein|uniref:MmyB family transcriptional regulator n=1 Tax=Amnibacterium sp. TaxID=1872496 RepID=UPI002F9464E6
MIEPGILPDIRRLMASWVGVPAFIRDERLDVVAANPLATALSESFTPGVNLARFAFLDPGPRSSAEDWSDMAGQVVAVLRASATEHRGDADLRRLVGELASKDRGFADTWALDRRDAPKSAALAFDHDTCGTLQLWYQQLPLTGDGRLVLVVWHPADEATREALADLEAMVDG